MRPRAVLNPADGPLARFAIELRALRDAAGPQAASVDDIVAGGCTTKATVYSILQGKRVPNPQALGAIVTAWGGDPQLWMAKRSELINVLRPNSEKPPAVTITRLPARDSVNPLSHEYIQSRVAITIRTQRARLGWSAQNLADRCAELGATGLSRGTIAKIESGGRRSITAEEAIALAMAFGVSVDHVLGLDTPPPPQPQAVAAGEIIALAFRVADTYQSESGTPMAHLTRITRHGEPMECTVDVSLSHDDAWRLAAPDAVHNVAAIPAADPKKKRKEA